MKQRAQVTIFIIMAIVIVAGIILYFSIDLDFTKNVPREMRPVYENYLSCLEEETLKAVRLMGEQAGYIEVPRFVAGSTYAPSSSQLNFFGQGVPYWIYLSGNNILREQIPTINGMQTELNNYLGDRLTSCDFSGFEEAGFYVYVEEGDVKTKINNNNIEVEVNNKVTIFRDDSSIFVENHKFKANSMFGKFYDLAIKVIEKEKRDAFLEYYAVDVMRQYAPVDGVELSCVPKVFVDEEIRRGLYDGLEANINSLKLEGDYYDLSSEERGYFVTDIGEDVQANVNFMYSRNWPTKIEIYGDRVVKPVGAQDGLEALGFCFTPYHFVYDINFPVMVQFMDNQDFFQFPISVIINKNRPRGSVENTPIRLGDESRVCEYNNAELTVYTYDMELNPVEASLLFSCLGSNCDMSGTLTVGNSAVFDGFVPTCVNAQIVASAEGYSQGKVQISTNSESFANILLKKEYELDFEIGEMSGKSAVVTFTSEDYSSSVVYPEMNRVKLVEGSYEVSVYVYQNSKLKIPGINERICAEVPSSGISGFVGQTQEKCYDINFAEMEVGQAIIGGGSSSEYITTSQLKNSRKLNLNVEMFGPPVSIETLQGNYEKLSTSNVYLNFE